jgi:ABC-2 type transport system ATP-binding protein
MTQLLRLDGLNRAFGGRQALKDVTFDVAPGRLTGFVGANGAVGARIYEGSLLRTNGRTKVAAAWRDREAARLAG